MRGMLTSEVEAKKDSVRMAKLITGLLWRVVTHPSLPTPSPPFACFSLFFYFFHFVSRKPDIRNIKGILGFCPFLSVDKTWSRDKDKKWVEELRLGMRGLWGAEGNTITEGVVASISFKFLPFRLPCLYTLLDVVLKQQVWIGEL